VADVLFCISKVEYVLSPLWSYVASPAEIALSKYHLIKKINTLTGTLAGFVWYQDWRWRVPEHQLACSKELTEGSYHWSWVRTAATTRAPSVFFFSFSLNNTKHKREAHVQGIYILVYIQGIKHAQKHVEPAASVQMCLGNIHVTKGSNQG